MMNVKNKIIKSKQSDKAKNRYNTAIQNDTTPNMLKSKENINNKQNNFYHINQNNNHHIYKQNPVYMLKSMELPKRMKTQVVDNEKFMTRRGQKQSYDKNGLCSSQQLFNFKYKTGVGYGTFGENLTFGGVNSNRQHLMTSRDFLEQKKLKTQIIDSIIQNNKRGLCRSFNQFSIHIGNCNNHNNKKAKYRLICQLTQGQQQMFYCSKCAINLLQRGFKIEQIKEEGFQDHNSLAKIKSISKYELRLKSLQERSRSLCLEDVYRDDMQMIEQQIQNVSNKYQNMFYLLEQMRKKDLLNLTQLYQKKQNERRISFDNIRNIQQQIQIRQNEIKELISNNSFLTMNQKQFNFLLTNLNDKISHFQQQLSSYYISNHNRHRISFQIVTSNQIITRLQQKIGHQDQNQIKMSLNLKQMKASLRRQKIKTQESMGCDQLKHPFRILFPSDQSQYIGDSKNSERNVCNNKMLSSVRQCPSFGSYA